ncbi:hypothetical protein LE181_27605 [Streptomyces sp. SCA3-4]|uniref:hypothetical protein n=1 Tax=Streptomyces sichuanensis TaxID=2871810 RepID=UPI001CE2D940|nr:hypothetical protein [Streptomyces sichuanensis]MCA6095916.1 hypothetical protein [Streptomyces sichuanensis]
MSKRQKGRRHRRVNRTPRPVGSTRPSTARPESRPEQRQEARTEPRPVPVSVPGLGRHEARTFDGLRALGDGGASVDELCAAVGYQARTILKHVNGLAGHGLAELRGDRWYATAVAELADR